MLDRTTASKLINPHMPVVGSNGIRFATVDHLEGDDTIKLTRDESGQHHYIPLDWVTEVDEQVHIDRPGQQAMEQWSDSAPTGETSDEPAGPAEEAPAGSIEQMRGRPLAERVEARKAELEAVLADLGPEESIERREIEQALATVESLSTGDLTRPSDVVASQLSDWLERNKNLGLKADDAARPEAGADDREP
jgi:hypothetical protein